MKIMKEIIFKNIKTELGQMLVGVTDNKLCLLEFAIQERISRTLTKLQKKYHYSLISGEDELLTKVENDLTSYFEGTLKKFDFQLGMIGTEFEKIVWNQLLKIPYGQTRSYLEIAKSIGKPTGFRAVARANGSNNISIIIPCHRVIASNGNLQGYGGELWRKDILLRHEKYGLKIDELLINKTKAKNKFSLLEQWIN